MKRIVRVRSGVSVELEADEYTYTSLTTTLVIADVEAGDIFKIWYTSATAPATQFTPNTTDTAAIFANSVDIYLYVPGSGKPSSEDYLYRLQNVTLDISLTRSDQKEIGNDKVVQRGVDDKVVRVTLGSKLESATIQEVLRGVAPGYGKLDVSKFTDQAVLIVKIYSDETKANFKYGFKATGLALSESRIPVTVKTYPDAESTLEGKNLTITEDVDELV
jgi:hypothetical protein